MKSKQREIEKILKKIDNNKIYYLKAKNFEELEKEIIFLHRKDKYVVVKRKHLYWLRYDPRYIGPDSLASFGFNKEADEYGLFPIGEYMGVYLWAEK